jgi:hypothetical protein
MDQMPPPLPPSEDDLRLLTDFGHLIGSHIWAFLTTAVAFMIGLIWRASAERQTSVNSIKTHRDKLDEHAARITALEQGAVAIAVKIGELPTRGELVAQTARMDQQFDRLTDLLASHPSRTA